MHNLCWLILYYGRFMSLINNPKHMQSKIFSSESLAWTHIYKTMLMLCAPNIFIFVLTTINKLTPSVSVITQIEAPLSPVPLFPEHSSFITEVPFLISISMIPYLRHYGWLSQRNSHNDCYQKGHHLLSQFSKNFHNNNESFG